MLLATSSQVYLFILNFVKWFRTHWSKIVHAYAASNYFDALDYFKKTSFLVLQ
jgi:hypothetical protein